VFVQAEPEAAQAMLLETIHEIWTAQPSPSPSSDCQALRALHTKRTLSLGLDSAARQLLKGDIEGVRSVMERTIQSTPINGVNLQASSLIDWDDWAQNPLTAGGLPTGFPKLDNALMGGLSRTEMMLIFGVSNMGKSITATNVGHAGLKANVPTLHIDSENGLLKVRSRYLSRLTGQPQKRLERKQLQSGELMTAWAKRSKQRLDKLLKIMCIGVGVTKFDEVVSAVDALISGGFVPRRIIFDSPTHLQIHGSETNYALEVKTLYERIKGWVQRLNCDCIVVDQAKLDAEDRVPNMRDIAWGGDKARIVDVMAAIGVPMNNKGVPIPARKLEGNPFRTLNVIKVRSGESRFHVKMHTDFAHATIRQSSIDADVVMKDDEEGGDEE